jgi:exonuclease III
MRFGTWNVRSLKRSELFTAVAREQARYKLDFMGVQELRWDKWGTVRTGDLKFYRERIKNHQLGREFFCTSQNRIGS